jgi:hypothetical protein
MKETQALIQRVRRVNDTHQHITLSVEPTLLGLKAGQAMLRRPDANGWQPYLPDIWFPVALEKDTLTVERPLAEHYEPGTVVTLAGLLGKPFRFRRTLRNVLLIAHDTPPTALLMPVQPLLNSKVNVTLLLLGTAADYGTGHLPEEVEIIKGGADFDWPNRLTTIGWADQIFVTVSPLNEQRSYRKFWAAFRELRSDAPAGYIFGIFQMPMPCGVGACDACLVKCRSGEVAACIEGPALDLTDVRME